MMRDGQRTEMEREDLERKKREGSRKMQKYITEIKTEILKERESSGL